MKIKTLLAALLIAALLLTPVAMMEETDAAPTVTLEETASDIVAEVKTEPEDDADAAQLDTENTVESDEEIVSEPVDTVVDENEDVDLLNLPALEAQSEEYELDLDAFADQSVEASNASAMLMGVDGDVIINKANFPDDCFRDDVSRYFDKHDANGNSGQDGVLSRDELESITEIFISGDHDDRVRNLKDLTGIKLFPNLKRLTCFGTALSSIDVSGCTNLNELEVDRNQLTSSLTITGCPNLEWLVCSGNKITSLNISECVNLRHLSFNHNQLSSIDVSIFPSLEYLDCRMNKLTSLDIKSNTKLYSVATYGNMITELYIGNCERLVESFHDGWFSNPEEAYSYDDEGNRIDYIEYGSYKGCGRLLSIEKNVKLLPEGIESNSDKSGNTDQSSGQQITTETPAPAAVTAPAPAAPVTIAKVPASAKAKAGKKGKVTVSWKKIKKTKKTKTLLKQIKGIEVQYSTDPTFATNVQTKNLGKKKTKVTLKGLQKKTVYYIRVRYIDGAGGVSNWSTTKKVKTKK